MILLFLLNPSNQASLFKVPESPQAPPNLPLDRITPTDDKDLDNQKQLVKQIQTILGTQQIKLEMMMKQHEGNHQVRKSKT